MDFNLSPQDKDVLERARDFTHKHLYPNEIPLDTDNALSAEVEREIDAAVVSHGLNAINHKKEHGGQEMSVVQQCIVNEEIGSSTNVLWGRVWQPPICLTEGTPEQIEKYLIPACRGDIKTAFCTTEPQAGSDAGGIQTTARLVGNQYVINGEKCFASMSDTAELIFLTTIVDGDKDKPTLFLIDQGTPGFNIRRKPRFSIRDGYAHPEVDIQDLKVPPTQMFGEIGDGFEMTKDWFVEARMAIAARSVGMAVRALDLALDYAKERQQFGRPIIQFQAIEFRLADMAARVMAAKSLVYRVAAEMDAGIDRRLAHGKASAAKLFCSEAAIKTVDEAAQIFAGQSVMCDNAIERLIRDVRVERIWEGTSDIQRVIIGQQLNKYGPARFAGLAE